MPVATGSQEQPPCSCKCQCTPLTGDSDDRARVTELLKGLSKWPGCSSTYPMVKGVSTCISVIPQLCQEGPGYLGHRLASGHPLVMKDGCAVSSSADSCHWRARNSRLVPSAAGAGWAGPEAAQVLVSQMCSQG